MSDHEKKTKIGTAQECAELADKAYQYHIPVNSKAACKAWEPLRYKLLSEIKYHPQQGAFSYRGRQLEVFNRVTYSYVELSGQQISTFEILEFKMYELDDDFEIFLIFKDGDKTNCKIDNLHVCFSRNEVNKYHFNKRQKEKH